jgi:hypothetical protein
VQPEAVRRFCGSSHAKKSLVARRSGKKGQFSEVSTGVIQNDICEFESSRPSQPVTEEPDLTAPTGFGDCARFQRMRRIGLLIHRIQEIVPGLGDGARSVRE